ncbi:MAG: hypothetical protein WD555_02385 [Fulvivirga sp.]
MKEHSDVKDTGEKPPLFRSWKAWYLLVIGNLIFLIMLFYIFTRYYS